LCGTPRAGWVHCPERRRSAADMCMPRAARTVAIARACSWGRHLCLHSVIGNFPSEQPETFLETFWKLPKTSRNIGARQSRRRVVCRKNPSAARLLRRADAAELGSVRRRFWPGRPPSDQRGRCAVRRPEGRLHRGLCCVRVGPPWPDPKTTAGLLSKLCRSWRTSVRGL
jgi:hypothetical protein